MSRISSFLLGILVCVGGATAAETAGRAAKAEELYRLVLQLGGSKEMPYAAIAALPAHAEQAGFPPPAVDEFRQIAREWESECRRLEQLMVDALSGSFSEKDLQGLVAFGKSELGRKLGQAVVEKHRIVLTEDEVKQLQGFARVSLAWKFQGIPRRLKRVQKETENSMAALLQKVDDLNRRYPERTRTASPGPGDRPTS